MTILPKFENSCRQWQFIAGIMVVCFSVFILAGSSALANPNQNKSSGFGGGVSITIDLNKLNKKKKKKTKKAVKKKRKKKAAAKPRRKPVATGAIAKYRSNHILGLFVTGTPDETIDQVAADYGLRRLADADIQLIDSRLVKFAMRRKMSALRALELANDPRVISAQPNYLYQMAASTIVQYAVTKLEIPKAHETARGQGTIIAVIDSGVRTKHPALANSVIEQFNAVGKRGFKDFSHGTGIASIIGARKGMVSVAPGAQILSSIVFAKDKKGGPSMAETYNVIRGVDWAVSKHAQIINMSFTGARDPAFDDVLNAAHKAGVISVAAAGNLGSKAPPAYPAAYPQVIAVTATDARDRLYKRANRGDYVTIAAPGVDVMVASRHKGFGLMSGTSAATGYVSGALALLAQRQPQLNTDTAVEHMAATARDLGKEGRDPKFGYGLLNISNVVSAELASQPPQKTIQGDVLPVKAQTAE
ncbi:MAG: S8 family serine peptidase [Hyphomicrobiales bacterium]|nr:S8 family serine peptidase [Hyphomicrobiales bacterium]